MNQTPIIQVIRQSAHNCGRAKNLGYERGTQARQNDKEAGKQRGIQQQRKPSKRIREKIQRERARGIGVHGGFTGPEPARCPHAQEIPLRIAQLKTIYSLYKGAIVFSEQQFSLTADNAAIIELETKYIL